MKKFFIGILVSIALIVGAGAITYHKVPEFKDFVDSKILKQEQVVEDEKNNEDEIVDEGNGSEEGTENGSGTENNNPEAGDDNTNTGDDSTNTGDDTTGGDDAGSEEGQDPGTTPEEE